MARSPWWLAALSLIRANSNVRRLVVLTQPRSGSSWTGGLLSDGAEGTHTESTRVRHMLPLFEMFNPGFPFAHLNVYSSALHRAVKSYFARTMVAPLLPTNSSIRKQLEAKKGALVALSLLGKSEYHKFTLGHVMLNERQAALEAAARLASSMNASWLWFKVMHPEEMPLVDLSRQQRLVTSATAVELEAERQQQQRLFVETNVETAALDRSAPTDVLMLLRRNVFHATVSMYKLAAPATRASSGTTPTTTSSSARSSRSRELGDFQNFDTTEYTPRVPVLELEEAIRAYLRVEERYFAWANVSGAAVAQRQPRPLVARSNGAAPGVLVLAYEELTASADPGAVLASRLREAAGEPVLSTSAAAGPVTVHEWSKQDTSSSFAGKVSNYDELRRWFSNATTRARVCAGAVRVLCVSDSTYDLPS